MERHEQMVVVFAPDTNDIANDVGISADVSGMIVEGWDGVKIRRRVHLGGGFVNDLNGGSRGRTGVLWVHGDDDDSVNASRAEVLHDGIDVRLAVLHTDSDIILLAQQAAEFVSKVARVEEERGTALVVPDGSVGFGGFRRSFREDEEVEDEPLEEGVEIDDAGVAEKLAEILTDVRDVERGWGADINQENAGAAAEWWGSLWCELGLRFKRGWGDGC